MLKLISFLIFMPVLFVFFISESVSVFQTKGETSPTTKPTPPNSPAKIVKLDLSKSKIFLPCPPKAWTPKLCSDDFIIDVHADAVDADNDALIHKYTVSAGKIIGQGARVKWDLSGVKVGTYELRAEVDDGCGFCGESKNVFVEVKECDGCHLDSVCECPTISVRGPADVVLPGEPFVFTANVSGGSQENVTYNWTVSKGKIVKGQETPVVEILPEAPESPVTATVEIGGLCESCVHTVSGTAVITID